MTTPREDAIAALREALAHIDKYEDAMGHSYCDLNVGGGWASDDCTCDYSAKRARWGAALAAEADRGTGDHESKGWPCGNCRHDSDIHSPVNRELCAVPGCDCPGLLTSAEADRGTLDYESEWYRKGWEAGHTAALAAEAATGAGTVNGPSVSELLNWFDRCEGLPTIRAAIGAVLRRESRP